MHIVVRQASETAEVEQVRQLFLEYQRSLRIDLCFQDFQHELDTLPGAYAPPQGRLYLAWDDGNVVGCVGLRPLDGETGEIKRLYVRPAYRGQHAGVTLARRVIADGRGIGYARIVLDTLPSMAPAKTLYESLGFVDTAPYTANPVPGVRFMALSLAPT